MQKRTIILETHNKNWAVLFRLASDEIYGILGSHFIKAHHIGSTAIKSIMAKPIIDILIEVRDISQINAFNSSFSALGYVPKGEYGIKGRRFFQKSKGVNPTHNIHIFQKGHPEIKRHLFFKYYLNTHPKESRNYSELKLSLSKKYPFDINTYTNAKSTFIKEINEKAAAYFHKP